MSDTTTQLNPGAGGDAMDESLVEQSDGLTVAKRPRVVVGDDDGNLYAARNPMPVGDRYARLESERSQLLAMSKLNMNLNSRCQERITWGDRMDVIDRRGPGGR